MLYSRPYRRLRNCGGAKAPSLPSIWAPRANPSKVCFSDFFVVVLLHISFSSSFCPFWAYIGFGLVFLVAFRFHHLNVRDGRLAQGPMETETDGVVSDSGGWECGNGNGRFRCCLTRGATTGDLHKSDHDMTCRQLYHVVAQSFET
jgi:hypothetical protein